MDSVSVVIRFRAGEKGDLAPWRLTSTLAALEGKDHDYTFDAVLGPDRTQEELYFASSHNTVIAL
jgi:hypothetical protein